MDKRPKKRSITLHGHRTSVSIEDAFWDVFCDIATERGLSINALAADVDVRRELSSGLAAAIRLEVLEYYQGLIGRS